MALSFLASMSFAGGDFPRAMVQYRDAESAFATVGDKPELARVQCETGYAPLAANDLAGARQHFRRALRTFDENGSPRGLGQALIGLAAVEASAGNATRAVEIATAAQAMSERAGVVVEHPMAPGVAERIAALRATIPPAELDALQRAGGALTPADVLAMAS